MPVRSNSKLDVGRLLEEGIVRLSVVSSEELVQIADQVGVVLRHDAVVARESRGADDNTLSGRHGLAALPPHTDGATNPVPPRWIAMRCPEGSDTQTLFYDTKLVVARPADASELRRLWIVKPSGGRSPFYAPVLQFARGGWWIRFNTACMSPVGSDGAAVLRLITGQLIEHRWQPDEAVVFDNWRFFTREPPYRPASIGGLRG